MKEIVLTFNQSFFFRSGPTFNLRFAFQGDIFILKTFGVQELNWTLYASVTATAAFIVFFDAVLKICGVADVIGIVGTFKNINEVHTSLWFDAPFDAGFALTQGLLTTVRLAHGAAQ